jgi:hypothetical protein
MNRANLWSLDSQDVISNEKWGKLKENTKSGLWMTHSSKGEE